MTDTISRFRYETRAVRVTLRPGASDDVDAELSRMRAARALLITTRGRLGPAQRIAGSASLVTSVFDGARLHVPAGVVAAAVEQAERSGCDALVAVGGGSAIGVAKGVALETGLPIIAVATTYSGSEMTSIWGITEDAEKRTGRNERVAPRVVLYDPLLTLDLDVRTSAASGLNAIAHAVEALYAPDANPLGSALAREAIRLMARSLRRILEAPRDVGARADALGAAHLAGRALDMTTMGLQHKLCHVLGGTFGLPHAPTHAIVLPFVVAYNSLAAPDALAAVARALDVREPDPERVAGDAGHAARALFALNRDLGLNDTLADLGLMAGDVERAARAVVEASPPNPAAVMLPGLVTLLDAARQGGSPGRGA